MAARERGGVLGRPEISKLTRETCDEKGLSVDEFIINALYAGFLMESKDIVKHYVIPIPSFGEYLKKLPIETPSEMNN
ncbi:MAG: hypothetical protein OXD01_12090 [Gammaproteobacteria bacterium]|nr:hypothetical protein [Gammaproteobacteria bacterium]